MNIMNLSFNLKLIINCPVFISIKFYEKGSYTCEVNTNCFSICWKGQRSCDLKNHINLVFYWNVMYKLVSMH